MLDSSLAFSDLPIRLLFGVGMLALAVALVYGAIVLVARLTGLIAEPGYAPTVLLIAGFGALNALGLSVVGAYAWRAFENTKARPLAIVRSGASAHVRARGEARAYGAVTSKRWSAFLHPQAMCESKHGRARARASGRSRTCCRARASAPTATSAITRSSRTTSSSATASR